MKDKKIGSWIFCLDSIIWIICLVKITVNPKGRGYPVLSKHSYQNINFSNDKCKYYTIRTPDTIHPQEIIFINIARSPWLSYEPENCMEKKTRHFWKKYWVQKTCWVFQPSRRGLETLHFVFVLHEREGGWAAQHGAALISMHSWTHPSKTI